jgi:hypothetical protein
VARSAVDVEFSRDLGAFEAEIDFGQSFGDVLPIVEAAGEESGRETAVGWMSPDRPG